MDQVQCPKCNAVIRLSERIYGKKFRCKCGIKIQMPNAPLDAVIAGQDASGASKKESLTEPKTFDLTKASEGPQLGKPKIRFQCPGCFMIIEVPHELAGYVSRCTCGIKVRIPQ